MPQSKHKSILFSPTLPQLFWLFWYSLRHPRRYADSIPFKGRFVEGSIFLLTCLAIDLVGRIILHTIVTRDPVTIFQGTTEGLITLIIVYLLYLVTSLVLFCLSKLIRGQATWIDIFRCLTYSSVAIIGYWLPILRLVLILYSLYFLLISLSRSNDYPITMAIFTVLTPILAVDLVLTMLGLWDLNLLTISW